MNKLSPVPVPASRLSACITLATSIGTCHPLPSMPTPSAIRRSFGRWRRSGCRYWAAPGRSPKDKFFVEEPGNKDDIDWGMMNRSVDQATFDMMHKRAAAYLQDKDVYVQDLFAGADPAHQLSVRVVTDRMA